MKKNKWHSTRLLPLESSGVIQLLDGRLLVINDELDNALTLLTMDQNGSCPPRLTCACHPFIGKHMECAFDDLEGVTLADNGWIYVINAAGMLSRFKIQGNRVTNIKTCSLSLERFFCPPAEICNIEGLCWDKKGKRLLIGFRNPLSVDNEAQVGELKKPGRLFKDCQSGVEPKTMDLLPIKLNGCAIRDITPFENGFLILSGPPDGKSGAFNLYYWDGKQSSPVSMVLKNSSKLDHAEGVSVISFHNKGYLILVRDISSDLKKLVGKCPELWECVVENCPKTETPKNPVAVINKTITMPGKYLLARIKELTPVKSAHPPCEPKTSTEFVPPKECS